MIRPQVPPTRLLLASAALLQGCDTPDLMVDSVFLDGQFDEWSGAATILEDGVDAPDAAIDLGAIHGLDDAGWFYLSIDLGREVSV